MPLRLFYITNNVRVAAIAQDAGVDAVFVDLEILGKEERQGRLDTVISRHTLEDVKALRKVLHRSSLLVRINPINPRSKREINAVLKAGADIIMLPMFSTAEEVQTFLNLVDGRAGTCLLVETPGAVEHIDEILSLSGIDSIHLGLNDLHLAYGKKFMFELLADGTVDRLARKIAKRRIRYGFGGIAALGRGRLPAEYVITEHYRLRSHQVILSRSFCDTSLVAREALPDLFHSGIAEIRAFEQQVARYTQQQFQENHAEVARLVAEATAVELI